MKNECFTFQRMEKQKPQRIKQRMNRLFNFSGEGIALLAVGVVVVFLAQLLAYPEAAKITHPGTRKFVEQLVIAAGAAGVALMVYNPVTQPLQDTIALSQSSDSAAYLTHAAIFGGVSLGMMYAVDGARALVKAM